MLDAEMPSEVEEMMMKKNKLKKFSISLIISNIKKPHLPKVNTFPMSKDI